MRARVEKPRVRTRIILPRPGVPARRHCRPKEPRAGIPKRGHYRSKCPTRLPTGWDHRFLAIFLGALRADSWGFPPTSEEDPRRKTAGSDSIRACEAWCPRKGTPQTQSAEAWCPRTGTLQTQNSNTTFGPSLEILHRDKVVLSWQPSSYFFAVVPFVVYRGRRVLFLRGSVYDGRNGQSFFQDH